MTQAKPRRSDDRIVTQTRAVRTARPPTARPFAISYPPLRTTALQSKTGKRRRALPLHPASSAGRSARGRRRSGSASPGSRSRGLRSRSRLTDARSPRDGPRNRPPGRSVPCRVPKGLALTAALIIIAILRAVLGQHVLDELLSERDKINAILQEIIDEATTPWGIKVARVEVKDLEIPSGMQQAMARQAGAERERRRKLLDDHLPRARRSHPPLPRAH